jgi:hypothetical protein
MRDAFAVKDLDRLHYFVGVEVHHQHSALILTQRKYAMDLLQRAGMLKCTPTSTPMTVVDKLSAHEGTILSIVDATRYRSVVGGLQYLTLTHSDLSFVVSKVWQYLHAPRDTRRTSIKRVLRFVKFTVSHGLTLCASDTFVSMFSDVD